MGVPYILNKSYRNHFGLDLKNTDLNRGEGFASSMDNAQYRHDGTVEKRLGNQGKVKSANELYSLFEYNRFQPTEMTGLEPVWDDNTVNIKAGDSDDRLISMGDRVYQKRSVTLTITYTGAGTVVTANIFYDTDTSAFRFRITEDGTDLLDTATGLVTDGGGFTSMDTLNTSINALADFTSTVNPAAEAASVPATFIDVTRPISLATAQEFTADYWDEIPQESATQTTSVTDNSATEAFEPPTAAKVANVLYLTNGYDDLLKFDGQYVYRAGLPRPDEDQITLTARDNLTYNRTGSAFSAGLEPNDWYSYRFQYSQRDAAGNIITGNVTQRYTVQMAAAGTGPGEIIASDTSEAGTTSTVVQATGHNAEIGDFIDFTSGTAAGSPNRQITDITTNTITVSPAFAPAPSGAGGENFDVKNTGSVGTQLDVPVIESTTGFNTRSLEFADNVGSPSDTLTVTSSAGWYPGDVVWLYDYLSTQAMPITEGNSPDSFKQVRILEVTNATTIVIDQSVEVRDSTTGSSYRRSDIGSNGTTILVWRTKGASSEAAATALDHYLVGEFPLNPDGSGTVTILDNLSDEAAAARNPSATGGLSENPTLLEPVVDRSPPPKGRYITEFRNLLVIGGDLEPDQTFVKAQDRTSEIFPNTISWSDVDSPEYFPNDTNFLNVSPSTNDKITGIAGNNNTLIVFKNRSADAISGDLALGNIRVDPIIGDIGSVSHQTIKEVRGMLYFLSERGPYMMIGGQNPTPLGQDRIEPLFKNRSLFNYKRCQAVHHTFDEQYWLYVPKTDGNDPLLLVFDYNMQAWLQWSGLDLSHGVVASGNDIYFNDADDYTYKQLRLSDSYDYLDHDTAISFSYADQWEALQEPSVLKRFLSARIFTDDVITNNTMDLTLKTEVNYVKDTTKANVTFNFDSLSELAKEKKLSPGRFRSLRVIFENAVKQQGISLTGWELQIAARYKGTIKS